MKVQTSQIFSMVNRLADIVEEEGITDKLPELLADRFSALDVQVVSADDKGKALRTVIADHWAVEADRMTQDAGVGPRTPGPIGQTDQIGQAEATEGESKNGEADRLEAAGALRNIARSILDAEGSNTLIGRVRGLSLVRSGLDALRRSGMTLLDARFETVANELLPELAAEAGQCLAGLSTETINVDISTGFNTRGNNLTFPAFLNWMRKDLENGEVLRIFPEATATGARISLRQLDTLIENLVDSKRVLNREILETAITDLHNVMTASGQTERGSFLDAVPHRFAEGLKKNMERLKFLVHFDQAYARVPLP